MDPANGSQYFSALALWLWLFPATYIIHIAEEYWGGEGYVAYLYRLRGVHMSGKRFLVLQSFGFIWMTAMVILSQLFNFREFVLALLGTITLLNGITHTLTAISHRGYGPGLVSCVLTWIPLGLITLILVFGRMTIVPYAVAVVCGIAIIAFIAKFTMRGGR